jgi:hypothetical protein
MQARSASASGNDIKGGADCCDITIEEEEEKGEGEEVEIMVGHTEGRILRISTRPWT